METLGWGLPGAIGARCGAPDRPVVAFIGDGAFFYHMAELETAARAGINVVVIVTNNSPFSQEKGFLAMLGQANAFGEPEEIYGFQKINCSRIAQEMGCLGIRVEKPDEIEPTLPKSDRCKSSGGCRGHNRHLGDARMVLARGLEAQAGELAPLVSRLIVPVGDFAVD